jgi:hypothetical protein
VVDRDMSSRMERAAEGAQGAQAEWLGMLRTLAEQIQKQQQTSEQMMDTCTQLFDIPVSYAQEGLRAARFPFEGHDELTVDEVVGRLSGLSAEELRVVRDYEERNKNRDTILEQLDRRIRSGS